ncbi:MULTISPECIES: hypothetical protein [Methylosinus]|uniref:Signal sequence receptor subunit alpha n=1 Tax=Methylosinus trichosporium (strain ATCC 35070 / NCIMB 11131 / UNIQEM 75 / OB3b) TaxID=595536 RepID=A0A2D2D4W6_METT3|nr:MULTISPECIES: hypothetical protein [Methylosinus]ATQ70060.1 hypothetical protein CQW49_20845 [Methylosinus trichosporium OB3b]OBS54413.1 hypothetical protein A8B73_00635 [Methylosinus sp. 3S-1]
MILRTLAAAALATIGLVSQAQAHGGVSLDQGQCIMKIGPDTMNFTGYQPLKSREQFCDDIPDVGPTIIVLDAVQDELRDMTLEIRILRDVGQKDDTENLEQNTEVHVPPKKYRTGTLNFEYDFAKKGKFVGLVTAKADDGREYVSRFPFSVGTTADRDFIIVAFFALFGLAGFGLWYKNSFIDKNKKKKAA